MADDLFDVEPRAAVPARNGAAPGAGSSGALPAGQDAIVLRLHVQPGAGRASVAGRHGDSLHVRVAPPPADNRANEACVAFVADLLDVKSAQVAIVGGPRSREKRVRVEGVDVAAARAAIAGALDRAGTSGGSTRSRGNRGAR
ncbi:MAG: DUF167 domain-containing protein [Acidimicrobiales bacterium]